MSFFSNEVKIANIDYRIKLFRARGEADRQNLINKLMREKRKLLKEMNNPSED